MKKLALLFALLLTGCDENSQNKTIQYDLSYTYSYTIPEENKINYSEFIFKSLSNVTVYEDGDDFVKEVENIANKLYGKPLYGLHIVGTDGWMNETNRSKMTERERQICDSLLRFVQ